MSVDDLNEEELKDIKRAFTIFITKVIKHSAINFVKREKILNRRFVSLTEYINNEVSLSGFDDGTFALDESVDYKRLEDIMSNSKNYNAVSKLSDREKQIIYLIYIEEKSVDEIAMLLNLTNKTILNTKNNALNKLRKDMEE